MLVEVRGYSGRCIDIYPHTDKANDWNQARITIHGSKIVYNGIVYTIDGVRRLQERLAKTIAALDVAAAVVEAESAQAIEGEQ